MTPGVVAIPLGGLATAGLLVLAAGVVSLALELELERTLALAATRTVVQLGLVGFVLRAVFDSENPAALALVVLVMVAAASQAATARASRGFDGARLLAFLSLASSCLLVAVVVTRVVLAVEPWWKPQYLIPLLGMILGNGLTGISLCLDSLLESFAERRGEIELRLALGAPWTVASRPALRLAVRRGMIPMVNSMSVVGLVSLPGMMTGQILSGTSPLLAVRYQIVVMFMLVAATALGASLLGMASCRRLFDERHRLRVEDLTGPPAG